MSLQRPASAEAYVQLVDRAIAEVDEFISCLEFDMEDAGDQTRVLAPILESVRQLRQSMADGSYQFDKRNDLPFMEVANRLNTSLPFAKLLATINETHRKGLDISAS